MQAVRTSTAFRRPAGDDAARRRRPKPATSPQRTHGNPLWSQLATGVQAKVKPTVSTGSQAVVQRMCAECEEESANGTVQPKTTLGAANDVYEKEADGVASQVMRMPVAGSFAVTPSAPRVSRLPQHGRLKGKASKPAGRNQDGARHGVLQNALASPSGGKPVEAAVRQRVEPVLSADLSSVVVHDNAQSREAAESIHAKAFTHRNHIYLGAGQSPHDVQLMAHELTHTVQQGAVSQQPGLPDVQAIFDVGCYRSRFAGVYETKRDFFFNRIGWVLIHSGECECEGQSVIDCCEPGDSYCAEMAGGCRGKSYGNCRGACTHRSGRRGRCMWAGGENGCVCYESG